MSGAVLCAGRAYCDLVFTDLPRLPRLGTEVFAGGLTFHAGGGAPNTAACLQQLGRRARLASVLPGPPLGAMVADNIRAAGVDMHLVATAPPAQDPQLTVACVLGGERAFLTRRCGPAIPILSPADIAAAGVCHLHVGELTTLIEHPDLIGMAREAGVSLSLDCGWDDALTASAGALIAEVDVFLPNADEATALARLGLGDCPAPLTVVKQGADGAEARWAGGRLASPAHAAKVVDTTGAGDAFNAGFLNRWLDGAPLQTCLAEGNAAGAAAVGHRGGVPTGADKAAVGAALSAVPANTAER